MSGRWYAVGLLGSAALVVAYIAAVVGPDQRPSGDPDFLPPDAELELLVDGADEDLNFTEGVVVTCDRRVLFSDLPAAGASGGREAGRILEYHPDREAISVFRSPSNGANGNRIDLACRLLTAERHRLVRTDLRTGRVEVVLGADAGGSFDALNDVAVDSKGRIYVTHPRYGALAPGWLREPGVYRIDPDGTVTGIISDAARPNGIAICPDERHIIVGSYGHEADVDREMALLRYDLAPDGTAANRRMLIDYAPQHGPDGLTCDIEGNLWVAIRDSERPGIYAYAVTDGVATERAYIPTPELPTNVHFGRGEGANYLYLTAGSSLYGIRVGKRGHHLQPRSAMRSEGGRNRARAARETALQPLPRAMVPQNRSRRALRSRSRAAAIIAPRVPGWREMAMAGTCTVDAALFDNVKQAVEFVAERGGGVVYTELAGTKFAQSLKLPPNVELKPRRDADEAAATKEQAA